MEDLSVQCGDCSTVFGGAKELDDHMNEKGCNKLAKLQCKKRKKGEKVRVKCFFF
jgi:hypothetical protein